MYATLSVRRLLALLGFPPLAAFALLVMLGEGPQTFRDVWTLVRNILAIWGVILLVIGAGNEWWAPWRLFWRLPFVERYLFPDLNGVWVGKTKSNWPSIKAMFDAYETREQPGASGSLETIPLQEDDITITVTASFFRFRIDAELASTGGTSHSVSARVQWNDAQERYEVYYLYTQETPMPKQTDEATHPGAARLVLDLKERTLSGEYWTKRSWRSGLNTAGLIEVARVSR